MSWIKDNLILLLAGATLVLGVGWVIDHYRAAARYSALETDYVSAQNGLSAAKRINLGEIAKLKVLQAKYNALVEARRLEQERLAQATARVEALHDELDAQLKANEALRERLALENPDVDAYLRAAMPCALAASLWPGAYDCEGDGVRRPSGRDAGAAQP